MGKPRRDLEEQLPPEVVAERLHLHVSTVWRLIKLGKETEGAAGIFPTYKLGHRNVRVPASAVNRYLESVRV